MSARSVNRFVSLLVLIALLLQPLAVMGRQVDKETSRQGIAAPESGLYRTTVTVDSPSRRARLEALGVVVLSEGAEEQGSGGAEEQGSGGAGEQGSGGAEEQGSGGAEEIASAPRPLSPSAHLVVLADAGQLEALARLRFEPRETDDADALVAAHATGHPGLATAWGELRQRMATDKRMTVAAANPSAYPFSSVAQLSSLDDDGDGLTNTEEAWWCTDPLNPNSDGDAQGYTDGQEVAALLDFTLPRNVRWGYGPPFGPPAAWPNFNNRDGTGVKVCNDGDYDTIPDYAEVYMVGTRVPEESTDRDKFDDGQELFGITHCPGAPTNCGYGSYPAIEYWNWIQARVPDWVLPPGDNPLVAAFPVPEVYVTAGSWRVERVTTITTSQGEMTQTEHSYETSVTRGQSTSIADTVTWNNWEEVSQAIETPLLAQSAAVQSIAECTPVGSLKCRVWGAAKLVGGGLGGLVTGAGGVGLGALCVVPDPTDLTIIVTPAACVGAVALGGVSGGLFKAAGSGWKDMTAAGSKPNEVQDNGKITKYDITNTNINNVSANAEANASVVLNQNFDFQGVVNSLDGVQYAISQQGELLARGLHDISYQLSRPRYTETRTNGHSWGGAQTITHEEYEEHSISEGQAFTTGENWSTAWAVDSSHAADLTFEFTVKNTGTEYARELSGIVVNVYIGDDTSPAISYPAWEKFPGGKLENLFPVGPNTPPGQFSQRTFVTNPIALSLEQMKRIDLGERLTVKVESYSYGADELFYTNAVTGGVTVYIEDGVEDGDETVDSYVIPTWGVEKVQDVLTRYFRCPPGQVCTDAEGNLNALWTPEFDGVNPPAWHEHYLSDIAWWNVYLTQADAGDTPLKDLPAQAGSGLLFRFNRDSDRDGYNDRAEFRYYCALPESDPLRRPNGSSGPDYCDDAHLRPEIHPQPKVAAGYVAERSGNVVTVKLAVQNTGNFDAYGIDAVMYSPDDTTTIGNNTVGGNGRVRPGHHVAVGSLIQPPDKTNWGASTSRPYAGGQFSGAADRAFTFTAETAGVVGQGDTAVRWSDGAGGGAVIPLGGSYHAPLPVDVAQGVQVGFNTGTIAAGARFTVQALTPRDTFTYTVVSDPYTPPVIVVSYSDPQGSHRFVTPVELPSLDASIAAGQMLEGLKLDIVTPAAFDAAGANTTNLVVNSPHPGTIQAGHLYLNFVSDGKLVLEKSYTLDIAPGPTVFGATWSVSEFSADYHPDGDNLLIAFWTDSEGNIIDSAARPLNSFAEDPKPAFAMATADETWVFGTAAQGTLLKRSFTFANTGALDLLTYVSAPAGLTVSQTGSRRVGLADMTTYEMTLNTANLSVGPYTGDIIIRTSDPDARERTVRVTGTVLAATADTPVGAMQRPLDWPATVSGNQGDWVEFAHTLGLEPQTLHPVKVYSQNYSTLEGVGKYATPFGAGTASYDMFGDGRDGVMPSSGNLDNNNGVGVAIVNDGSASAYSINVTDVYYGWRINPGDAVLIHQTQGTGAGCWELNKATSDYAGGTASIQLTKPLQCNYTSGGNNHAQIQRVPQYTDCPISGTVTPLSGWNGTWGGIVAVMCNHTINLSGTVNVTGGGFRGGYGNGTTHPAQQGEGTPGPGNTNPSANGNGGGGGWGDDAAGGGGGNGTSGGGGAVRKGTPGVGGTTGGSADLSVMVYGGGGGGGSDDANDNRATGGTGGGVVLLIAKDLTVTGRIFGSGTNGSITASEGWDVGGGGGSGGSILMRGARITLGTNLVAAIGGQGGQCEISGGNGGDGRVRVEYCDTISGSTNPPASERRLTCYIVEQVDSAPYDRARLNLPESGTHTYQVQYGRKLNWGGAANQVTTLRVPAGLFTSVTLQALVSDLPSNAWFVLDVGNTGSDSWNGTVGNGGEYTSPNLAAYFNAYWATYGGAPTTGTLDVPIRVYLDRAGQVLLTNLQVTPAGSKPRSIRLPVLPQGYSSVTASFTVSDGAGPLAVGVDVGGDGTVDWTYTGSPAYPASLTTDNLAAAVNAYLAGKSGEVDVPIHFYLSPFAVLNLTGFTATPVGGADASIGAGDVTFDDASSAVIARSVLSGDRRSLAVGVEGGDEAIPCNGGDCFANTARNDVAHVAYRTVGHPLIRSHPLPSSPTNTDPTESDTITINATIHNTGSLDTGPLTAAFYAVRTTQYADYIGSAFIPSVPPSSASSASVSWNTLGFTGTVPVRVVVDPYNRVAESNENNNVVTATVNIRTRPDLSIPAITLSDPEPTAGETVTVTLAISNTGQTAASDFIASLSDGENQIGGATIRLSAATSVAYSFPWTPATPGLHRLFARADRDGQVNESDEGNNDRWLDVYVGFRGPILVDNGNVAADPAYGTTAGFGYLNSGTRTISCGGSAAADATLRAAITSTLLYRFDYLLPGHFYHLDLTLRDCDGNRAEEARVDDMLVAAATDLSDHAAHRLSLLLDPALYRDRTVTVAIVETHGLDALLAEISLHDVDYRYADAGHSTDPNDAADPRYPGPAASQAHGRAYGWLDGERLGSWAPANLPGETVRMDRADDDPADDPDNELRYRFDGLDPARRYRLRLTFRQLSGAAVIQKLQLDGTDATPSFTLNSGQAYSLTVAVPPSAYATDGSILAGIVRVDCAASEAQVNEIALEEETLPAGNPCHVQATPNRTIATGGVTIRGAAAPVGTVIEAVNPRDDVVGCTVVSAAGAYPYVQIYGEDPPSIPGMRDGEIIEFRVDGIPAVAQPSLYWKSDTLTHTVNLSTGSTEGQCSWLASNWNLLSLRLDPPVPTVEKALGPIAGRYCQVRGEKGSYDCTLDPVYRTLKELDPGQGYYLKLEGGAGANLRIEGVTVPVTTPIPLHQYWNWVGYLPAASQPITTALQSIAGRYLLVLSKDKTYDPLHPGLSDLLTLEPGQGYQIRATEAVTLVYPADVTGAFGSAGHVDTSSCPNISPTPFLTLLYGQARLDGAAAPAGVVVEIVTPRGEVAGCTVVREGGGYGYVHVYGEDPTDPPIPGFRPGEPLAFRVAGRPVAAVPALAWQNDRTPHAVDLVAGGWKLWLPAVTK